MSRNLRLSSEVELMAILQRMRSPRSVSSKGLLVQGWPSTGTTSVWPESTMPPAMSGPMVAKRLVFLFAS